MIPYDNLSAEDLERIRRFIEEADGIDAVDDKLRKQVEKHWPWLVEAAAADRAVGSYYPAQFRRLFDGV